MPTLNQMEMMCDFLGISLKDFIKSGLHIKIWGIAYEKLENTSDNDIYEIIKFRKIIVNYLKLKYLGKKYGVVENTDKCET